ncbi:MAG: L-serine ammonia-lyase, iron-sulfur-dependent, subunit alpha, partial [Eubacteriales bacterium]|nr:L-serine ammonia-lyase, iron-sulfur-dependent, subunit alpha [Eubacteriales bacterium]
MQQDFYNAYAQIIHEELVAATGCTEPIAIAYCSAKAADTLGTLPKKISVLCSGNIIKNVMGVVVPNSGGAKGIDVAAVLGAVGGAPDHGLEVLSAVTDEHRAKTRELLSQKGYCTYGVMDTDDTLAIRVTAEANGHTAAVEIRGEHTHITAIEKDGQTLYSADAPLASAETDAEKLKALLSVENILQFADNVDLALVRGPLEAQIRANTSIAQEGLRNDYGVRVGKALLKRESGGDPVTRARALAAAGSDARMSGCPMPVVINSG